MVAKFSELRSFYQSLDFQDMMGNTWSWEKNKKFELALVEVNEDQPDRWDRIAKLLGGISAKDVEEHYNALVQDLSLIESDGSFDENNEHSDFTESPRFHKYVTTTTTTAPLGLCLNVENGTSLLELLTQMNAD